MAHAPDVDHIYGGQRGSRAPDAAIARLARVQHGLITRTQLTGLGLTSRSIDHRVKCGRLHLIHRGVYAVGHKLLTEHGRYLAAVLAGGLGAVLSHRSAAALWRIRPSSRPAIEVTVPRQRRSRSGLELHAAVLPSDETTTLYGIPVTTVARTLLDLAAVTDVRQVERAINEAEVLRLWDAVPLVALLHRYPGRAGTANARRALQARAEHGPTPTHEGLEEEFLKRVRAAAPPSPEVNVTIEAAGRPFEIDFLWREQRLAVELDSRSVHQTVQSFESDRAKDRALSIAGWRPVRFTSRQLDRVGGELPRLLGTV